MTIFLYLSGWIAAAFLALGLYSCRKNKAGWKHLYEVKSAALSVLERQHMAAELGAEQSAWYKAECSRLTRKCEAICRAARRAKGRGKATVQVNPVHNF